MFVESVKIANNCPKRKNHIPPKYVNLRVFSHTRCYGKVLRENILVKYYVAMNYADIWQTKCYGKVLRENEGFMRISYATQKSTVHYISYAIKMHHDAVLFEVLPSSFAMGAYDSEDMALIWL